MQTLPPLAGDEDLGHTELLLQSRVPGWGVRPNAEQSIARAFDAAVAAARRRPTALLAIDGLPWELANDGWAPDELLPVTTVFPSTSTAAWMTAVTGVGLDQHLVTGAVYRAGGELIDPVRGKPLDKANRGAAHAAIRSNPTVFEVLAAKGVSSVAVLGDLGAHRGPWTAALLRGATHVVARSIPAPGQSLVDSTQSVLSAVEEAIAAHLGGPLFVWAYVNLDEHVHRFGYTAATDFVVDAIEVTARRWAERGVEVIAVSDHGLVPAEPSPDAADAWARLERSPMCSLPPGGAGRVRWLHTIPGAVDHVVAVAREELAGVARVTTPRELADLGFIPDHPEVLYRFGDVVAIATAPSFPCVDPTAVFEHGSMTPTEMIVPLARWTSSPSDQLLSDCNTQQLGGSTWQA